LSGNRGSDRRGSIRGGARIQEPPELSEGVEGDAGLGRIGQGGTEDRVEHPGRKDAEGLIGQEDHHVIGGVPGIASEDLDILPVERVM
jgi:hypothetical protein